MQIIYRHTEYSLVEHSLDINFKEINNYQNFDLISLQLENLEYRSNHEQVTYFSQW